MPQRLRIVTINFWGNEPDVDARLGLAERQLRELSVDVIAQRVFVAIKTNGLNIHSK